MSRRRRPYSPPVQRPTQPTELASQDLVQAVAAEVVKALRLPPGAKATPVNQAALQQLASGGWGAGGATPLTPGGWTIPNVAFGPGTPVRPASIDPLDPGTGRPLPRRYEYPVTFNLPGAGDRVIPWTVLRQLADNVSIIRRCIEIRKLEMVGLDWDFVVAESVFEREMLDQAVTRTELARAKAAAAGDPDARHDRNTRSAVTRHQIETNTRARNAGTITDLRRWWTKPDRINDWTFSEWLTAALEDHFVLDAMCLFPHLTVGGDLHSVRVIDGATIKPLLDERGDTPQPPNPSYQQILHGFPRGEFTAGPGADGEYSRDTLIYRPRYRRANSPYGFGNTEQAILDADLWLKRQEWLRAEYAAGVVPELLIEVDTPMTPEQLLAYERVFNDILSGNSAERHRAKMLPQGFKPTPMQSFEERYKPEFDEHLIRRIALAFDVMPGELGFPPRGGLGGKGFADSEENITYRKAIRPTSNWLTGIFNEISTVWLRMPEDLTFQFLGMEAEDEASALNSMEQLARVAGITINEIRDETGRPRYDVPEADVPLIITAREVIPLDGAIARADAQAQPPAPAELPARAGLPVQQGQGEPTQPAAQPQPAQLRGKAAHTGPIAAGLAVVAQDSGRVLMLQRAPNDTDPAAGRWEMPGGHIEPGEDPFAAACREWSEETGAPIPEGHAAGEWASPDGVYRGFVWRVDTETTVPINTDPDERATLNPDDPDGDGVEVVAWWDPAHLTGNPAVRTELATSMPLVLGAIRAEQNAEKSAFASFVKRARNGDRRWRPFQFNAHPTYVGQAANALARDGDWGAALAALDVRIDA